MNIFYQAASQLSHVKELKNAAENSLLPACVTGLSAVHKAHALLALSSYERGSKGILVICDDEASASRLVSDINEMSG